MEPEKTAESMELVKAKEVIESYIFATSRRPVSLSIYSERLLMRIVEIAQRQVSGLDFKGKKNLCQVSISPLGEAEIDIPIKDLLGDGNSNYTQAKETIKELMSSPYSVERPKVNKNGEFIYDEKGELQFEYIAHQILNDCEVNVLPGIAKVVVNKKTWEAILDFSKGFRRFDLNAAMMLSQNYSSRMFRLVSNQKNPMTYTFDALKKMWGIEEMKSYKKNTNFLKRIEDAKKELDEKAPWTFDYEVKYNLDDAKNKGRRGRKSMTSITFYPKRKIANMSVGGQLNELDSPRTVLGNEIYELLLSRFGFTHDGIKHNLLLFVTANDAGMDLLDFLDRLSAKAVNASNPSGYVVRAVERSLCEKYGVVKTRDGYIITEKDNDKR